MLWEQENSCRHDYTRIIFLYSTLLSMAPIGDLPSIYDRHIGCHNLCQYNWYKCTCVFWSPNNPATRYEKQVCDYLGTLSVVLNQTQVIVSQTKFNDKSWTGVTRALWVMCLYGKESGPWKACHWDGACFLAHLLPTVIIGTDTGLFSLCRKRRCALGPMFLSWSTSHCTLGSLHCCETWGQGNQCYHVGTLAVCCAMNNTNNGLTQITVYFVIYVVVECFSPCCSLWAWGSSPTINNGAEHNYNEPIMNARENRRLIRENMNYILDKFKGKRKQVRESKYNPSP